MFTLMSCADRNITRLNLTQLLHNNHTMAASPPQTEEATNVAHRTRNAGRRDSIASAEREALAKKKSEKERAKAIRDGLKSDYIEPLKRRLGPLEYDILPCNSKSACIEPMDFHLRKIVGLVLTTQKNQPNFTEEFIDEMAIQTSNYLQKLISLLHKYTEAQRHRRPGIHDLELCLLLNNIEPGALYLEYEACQALPEKTKQHKNLLDAQATNLVNEFYAEEFHLDKNDPSLVFHTNDQNEVASLIPRQSERPAYIPDYFPTLPPDYTFQSTGSYMKTITELKEIKLKLVEESRLNQNSLDKLIEQTRQEAKGIAASDLESDDEDIMSVSGEGNVTDVESPHEPGLETAESKALNGGEDASGPEVAKPEDVKADALNEDLAENPEILAKNEEPKKPEPSTEVPEARTETVAPLDGEVQPAAPGTLVATPGVEPPQETPSNSKRFDFVAYAMRRKAAKERAAKKLAAHRNKRDNDPILKREKLYSPYAKSFPTTKDDAYFENLLQKSLKRVIRATREATEQKKIKIAELLAEKAKQEREQEKNSGSFEFGFAYNPDADVLDESEEDDNVGELDFGDDFKLIENRTDVAGKRPSSGNSQTAQKSLAPPPSNGQAPDFDDDDVGDLENELDNAFNEQENINLPSVKPLPHDDMGDFGMSDSESDSEEENVGQINFGNSNAEGQTIQQEAVTFEMNFPPEDNSEESEEGEMVDM